MPSMRQVIGAVAIGMVAVASALPKLTPAERRAYNYGVEARRSLLSTRQNPATGLPDGLTDIDILELYVSLTHRYLRHTNLTTAPSH